MNKKNSHPPNLAVVPCRKTNGCGFIVTKPCIKKKGNPDYKRYQELLIKRDAMKKEADVMATEFIRVFGNLINKSFILKIECIRLKKAIAFCEAKRNRHLPIIADALDVYLKDEMTNYYDQLDQMIKEKGDLSLIAINIYLVDF